MELTKGFNINSIVISLIALSQGMLCISELALSYLYKDEFSLDPSKVAILGSLVNIPWIIKPTWGFISDCYPIYGKRRSPYLILFGFIGVLCWLILGTTSLSFSTTLFIQLLIQISVCFCNVIGEALVVEESQKSNNSQKEASKYVTLFFSVKAFGTVLTAYTGGLLLEYIDKRSIFMLTAVCPCLLIASGLLLQEAEILKPLDIKTQFFEVSQVLRRKDIYFPVLFIFIFTSTPSCADAMFYYYTNHLQFTPEFMGRIRMALGIGSVIGMVIYYVFLQQYDFKAILISTTIVCSAISCSQLLLVTGVNDSLGIPTELFAICCNFIVTITAEMNMLPLLTLCCRICPKNIEGTLYALLMSTINFGGMLGSQAGGLLMILCGITQTEFAYLWTMVLISSLVMIAPLPMLSCIPSFYKHEDKKGYELV